MALAAVMVAALVTLEETAVTSASSMPAVRHSSPMKRARLRNPVLPDLYIYESIDDTNLLSCRTECANDYQCDVYMFVGEDARCFLHRVV